jgi:hypothetical protein
MVVRWFCLLGFSLREELGDDELEAMINEFDESQQQESKSRPTTTPQAVLYSF